MRQGELPQNLPALKAATPKLATPANLIDVCEQIDNAAQVSFYFFFFTCLAPYTMGALQTERCITKCNARMRRSSKCAWLRHKCFHSCSHGTKIL